MKLFTKLLKNSDYSITFLAPDEWSKSEGTVGSFGHHVATFHILIKTFTLNSVFDDFVPVGKLVRFIRSILITFNIVWGKMSKILFTHEVNFPGSNNI